MGSIPFTTFVLVLSLALTGCAERALSPETVLAPEAEVRTRQAARTILSGDADRIRDLLTTSATEEEIEGLMPTIRAIAESGHSEREIGTLQLVHAENRRSDAGPDAHPIRQASYELVRDDGILLVEVAVEDGGPEATGLSWFNVRPLDAPITGAHDFGTAPLTFTRAVFVAAMALNLLFIVVTFGAVLRDRRPTRRWAWLAFVPWGMWGLTLNWTSGALGANFLSLDAGRFEITPIVIKLLGGGFSRAAYAQPWMLEIGLPVGALVYWWRRTVRGRRRVENDRAAP